jgi:hypothetical protein
LFVEALKAGLLVFVLDRQHRFIIADAAGDVNLVLRVLVDEPLQVIDNVLKDTLLNDVIVCHASDGIAVRRSWA